MNNKQRFTLFLILFLILPVLFFAGWLLEGKNTFLSYILLPALMIADVVCMIVLSKKTAVPTDKEQKEGALGCITWLMTHWFLFVAVAFVFMIIYQIISGL